MKSVAFFIATLSVCLNQQTLSNTHKLLSHEQWWQASLDTQMQSFDNWLGDVDATSRVKARSYKI